MPASQTSHSLVSPETTEDSDAPPDEFDADDLDESRLKLWD